MGAFTADLWLLAAAIDAVQRFIQVFFSVYQFVLLAYIITSWIRLPLSMQRLQRFLHDVSDPYLRLFRRIVPSLGPIDLSPVVGLIALAAIEVVVLKILDQFR